MISKVLPISELPMVGNPVPRSPDLVLAFLPPGPGLEKRIAHLCEAWPEAEILGCEAATQFADSRVIREGCVQLLWLERPETKSWVHVLRSKDGEPVADEALARLAVSLQRADAAIFICDGLHFPIQDLLTRCARDGGCRRSVAGGCASQEVPPVQVGARVFHGRRPLLGACLVLGFEGVTAEIEIVRGWDPASPVSIVSRARGCTLQEIDGKPATDWFARFFSIDGELVPLPESAYDFPLILEGPHPDREGIYRSMRTFDDPKGTVTFWGDVRVGDRIRLGMGNDRTLVRTARRIATAEPPEAAILFSCVGREAVLGEAAEEEIGVIHEALGDASLAGLFTFGEIGPTPRGDLAFYNHTAVLALLRELAE